MHRIVIFAKAPVPGQVKTRLIPLLGADGAADLALDMLNLTCREAAAVAGTAVELCVTPDASDPRWRGRLPDGVDFVRPQGEGDLGERLARAAERVISAGEQVILIGTDCPALDRELLGAARDTLVEHDAFLHPAEDGGYALLGLRKYSPLLFTGISWSSSSVAAETIERLKQLGWTYALGEVLRDVDEPADFRACFGKSRNGSAIERQKPVSRDRG